MDYFIADLHFGDSAIMAYENRPFESVEEMDAEMIARWNQRVTDEDRVFVIGDFSKYEMVKDWEILSALHGTKILIKGNHDMHRTCEEWRSVGFAEVSDWPIIYNDFFMLSHEPLYINSNMPYANIFGHVHGNPAYKTASSQSVCVSVERIDYTPITLEEIMALIKGQKSPENE